MIWCRYGRSKIELESAADDPATIKLLNHDCCIKSRGVIHAAVLHPLHSLWFASPVPLFGGCLLLFLLRRIIRGLILCSALLLAVGLTLLFVLGSTLLLAIRRALLLAVGQTLLLILASLLLLTVRAILLLALEPIMLSGVGPTLLLVNDRRCFRGRRDLGLFRGGRLLGTPDGGRRKQAQNQDRGKKLFHVPTLSLNISDTDLPAQRASLL